MLLEVSVILEGVLQPPELKNLENESEFCVISQNILKVVRKDYQKVHEEEGFAVVESDVFAAGLQGLVLVVRYIEVHKHPERLHN